MVSTKDLETVGRVTSPQGTPAIDFSLKPAAAEKLKAYTTANQGKEVAIMLDNQVINAPRIGGVISKRGMINGKEAPTKPIAMPSIKPDIKGIMIIRKITGM